MATLSRIAPEVPVSDLQGALRFYEEKLGFEVVSLLPAGDYAVVERNDVAIHLFQADGDVPSPSGLHIFTGELEELYAEMQQRGAPIVQDIVRKPWGNRDFRVNDPWGNQLKFTESLSDDAE
jgi:uncharacterized glyoxalase superfamily protein PhnB